MEMDFLLGVSFSDWIKLLAENKFAIQGKYSNRALLLTFLSIRNSYLRRKEERLYKKKIEQTEILSPLFILGHWRSGTSLVHNLMILDKHFAYPNLFQTTHPHSFLILEKFVESAFANAESHTRPMDNMQVTYKSPGEDESAVAVLSQRSPIIGWGFTKNAQRYNRYHTFAEADKDEFERWRKSFIWYLKKLTWRYKLPLVLKSPIHTGRVRTLLEMFPNAKFIHIYRNPFDVFQSTLNLYRKLVPNMCLQPTDEASWIEQIIENYKLMYEAYFSEKDLIPNGHLCEIRFEEFEKDITGQMQCIYENLNIGDFNTVKKDVVSYVNTLKGYKKNGFPELPEVMRERLLSEWGKYFKEWDYLHNMSHY